LTPVFTLSGIDPEVADIFGPQFRALGLNVASVGGSYGFQASPASTLDDGATLNGQRFPRTLHPGDAVSVALATGDITIAGTGTVSRVDGTHLLAFGHPLMHLGAVDLPMASSEVVTILPSLMSSYKVVNVGPVIGTISQDRLSAVYGEMGKSPEMIPVTVTVPKPRCDAHPPLLRGAAGADRPDDRRHGTGAGHSGFERRRPRRGISGPAAGSRSPAGETVSADNLYAGPQGFTAGVGEFRA